MADNSDRPAEFEGEDLPTRADGYEPPADDGVSTAPGRVIDHYRLVRKLGEGGMAEVWGNRSPPVKSTLHGPQAPFLHPPGLV